MPIYEFKCRDCGTITENLVFTIKERDLCTCRNCGGNSTERIMSRPAILGRGAGGETVGSNTNTGYGYGNGSDAGTVNWPENDDYIKLKGQQ
ncbi:MAG: hypothetical protein JL56_05995 [Desulfotomaculum sp. BICA1-6]|nr:MAG: hypothetical protein VR67_08630 [Peptococcaceae bacterium BRH_c8a]KJS76087.1 MAG: hypothetical protein JL56_05995 [Desulfotomaculum sp. BICA1-6]